MDMYDEITLIIGGRSFILCVAADEVGWQGFADEVISNVLPNGAPGILATPVGLDLPIADTPAAALGLVVEALAELIEDAEEETAGYPEAAAFSAEIDRKLAALRPPSDDDMPV